MRGVVPDELNPTVARAIGSAFADAFAGGLTARGVDVVRIALASTDELYFASGRTRHRPAPHP